ncbi:MAG: hypothetical protein GX650_02300 [Clostridiales bacterium]|nr:hypothetical protein [Clostridiales bacterium]
MIIVALLLPMVLGALLPAINFKNRRSHGFYIEGAVLICAALGAWALLKAPAPATLSLLGGQSLALLSDGAARILGLTFCVLWPLATLFALEYMVHDLRQDVFFARYIALLGPALALCVSANLLTLLIMYHLIHFGSLPLSSHSSGERAQIAARRQLYYQLVSLVLTVAGYVLLLSAGARGRFVYGGGLDTAVNERLRIAFVLLALGFGIGAAQFPFHSWLPQVTTGPTATTALIHDVLLVSSGAYGLARLVYWCFGTGGLTGTWAQWGPLALACLTIVYGSIMAFRVDELKPRLAYSTASNMGYVFFGLLLMTPQGLTGGLLHLIFHALAKMTLFLAAGTFILRTGVHTVQDMRGTASRLPVTTTAFTVSSFSMIGLPPLLGFLSKWTLAQAAGAQNSVLAWVGMGALLISAVLTCMYLLIPAVEAIWISRSADALPSRAVGGPIDISLMLLTLMILGLAFVNSPLFDAVSRVALGQG